MSDEWWWLMMLRWQWNVGVETSTDGLFVLLHSFIHLLYWIAKCLCSVKWVMMAADVKVTVKCRSWNVVWWRPRLKCHGYFKRWKSFSRKFLQLPTTLHTSWSVCTATIYSFTSYIELLHLFLLYWTASVASFPYSHQSINQNMDLFSAS